MKLPQILAQTDVPIPPSSRGAADTAGASALAIGRGIQQIGDTVTDALLVHERTIQKAEATRRQQEAAIEVAQLESGAEMEAAALDTRLKETITDPDEYQRQWTSEMDAIRTRAFANARNPGTTPALQKSWPAIAQRRFQSMVTTKHAMVVDNLNANLRSNIETWKSLGSFEPLTPEGEATASVHLANIRVGIENARPLLGAKAAEDLWFKERDEFLYARGYRHAETNPLGFLAEAETSPLYRQMDGQNREELKKSALVGVKAIEKKAADEVEAYRKKQMTYLDDLSESRQLTTAHVRAARDAGVLTDRQDYEHFLTLARTGPKDAPSESRAYLNATTGVYARTPTYTEGNIRALMNEHMASNGERGLNREDGQQLLAYLDRKAETARSHGLQEDALKRQADALQHSRNAESYQRAIDEGLKTLGVTTSMSMIDGPAAALVAGFVRDMNARVLDAKGNYVRPAREALYEVLPIYMERQSVDAKTTYTQNAGLVGDLMGSRPPDPMDSGWLSWWQQQQRATEGLRATNPNLFKLRQEQLQTLLNQHKALIDAEARKAATGAGKAPTTYKAPRAVK